MRPDLHFFLDRGLGSRVVADGLRLAGWSCTTMDERYGLEGSQRVLDVEWIRDASAQGEVLLAKDKAMAKKPLEAEALYYNESRLFVMASAHVTGVQMLERLSQTLQQLSEWPHAPDRTSLASTKTRSPESA